MAPGSHAQSGPSSSTRPSQSSSPAFAHVSSDGRTSPSHGPKPAPSTAHTFWPALHSPICCCPGEPEKHSATSPGVHDDGPPPPDPALVVSGEPSSLEQPLVEKPQAIATAKAHRA